VGVRQLSAADAPLVSPALAKKTLMSRQVVCEGQSSSSSFFSAHSTAEKPQQNEQFS
jgi:hypothetical protein